jgi:hypothetical protein
LRALAERGGVLYAAGDNWMDNFALASSTDGGVTWKPLLRFDGICGPVQCAAVQTSCAAAWQTLVNLFEIPKNVCGQTGAGGAGGGSDSGCGCAVGGRRAMADGGMLVALGALAVLARRRRYRRFQ